MNQFESILPFLTIPFLLVFGAMWYGITRFLGGMAGMRTDLDAVKGQKIRETSWGSASVNGVTAKGCIKAIEYSKGWVLKMQWVFGGYMLWIPRDGLSFGAWDKGSFWRPSSRTLYSGINTIQVYDELARFFIPPRHARKRQVHA